MTIAVISFLAFITLGAYLLASRISHLEGLVEATKADLNTERFNLLYAKHTILELETELARWQNKAYELEEGNVQRMGEGRWPWDSDGRDVE